MRAAGHRRCVGVLGRGDAGRMHGREVRQIGRRQQQSAGGHALARALGRGRATGGRLGWLLPRADAATAATAATATAVATLAVAAATRRHD